MNSSNATAQNRPNFNDRRGSYIECTLTCVLEAKVLEPVLANLLPELGSQRPSISSACAFSLNLGPPRLTAIRVDYPPVSPFQLLCVLPLSGTSSACSAAEFSYLPRYRNWKEEIGPSRRDYPASMNFELRRPNTARRVHCTFVPRFYGAEGPMAWACLKREALSASRHEQAYNIHPKSLSTL